MKRQFLAALTCCTVAGLALGADPPQKRAAVPSNKTASSPASAKKAAAKTGTAGSKPATAQATASRSTAAHPTSTGPKVGTSPAGRASSGAAKGTASRGRYVSYRRQPIRRYSALQMAPTADRYREIQDALAAKGYLKTPSTGVWDQDSIDAMQRFQKDQNLEPTGKLTARSLSSLGLGPKPSETTTLPANPTASLSANPGNEASPLQ